MKQRRLYTFAVFVFIKIERAQFRLASWGHLKKKRTKNSIIMYNGFKL